ncbi:MAG: hypothetical protein IJG68_06955 [Bacilli bacterium]|nr:hypothetical protein [Bacilli bacterium]
MDQNEIMKELKSCIENIKLSKQDEKQKNQQLFKDTYGLAEADLSTAKDNFYLKKYIQVIQYLTSIRNNFKTNKDFYTAVTSDFARAYIPTMIKEYQITNEKTVEKLNGIASGKNIKIFEKGEAKEYASSFDREINGDVGAFKFMDMICFTPDSENREEVSPKDSILNAAKMLSSMIHETMHLVFDVTKEEYFNYGVESKLTSGGTILNEGLIEMNALDFSKKYDFPHLPAFYYLNNVKMAILIKKLLGDEKFKQFVATGDYKNLIPKEVLDEYKKAERIRYFTRRGLSVDPSKINLENETKHLF